MNDKETADYYRIRAGEYEKIYYREIPERRKEIDDEADRLRKLVEGKEGSGTRLRNRLLDAGDVGDGERDYGFGFVAGDA